MSYPHTIWRLIKHPPAKGAWNMAVDEAILEAIGKGEVPPTLRLYAWEPACLSLGYSQPVADVDRARLVERGWDLVRRPTGGRAILHTDELTYSVIGPESDPRLSGSVLESYRRLSEALLDALHRLGIEAQASEKPAPLQTLESATQTSEIPGVPSTPASAESIEQKNPVCFEMPSNYEITVAGKKLVGSAQSRRREGVLQHGSLPLTGDLGRITQALAFPDEASRSGAKERLLKRAATVESVLGFPVSWEQAAQAFTAAFANALNLELRLSGLTPGEETWAARLVGEKYGHPAWTERL